MSTIGTWPEMVCNRSAWVSFTGRIDQMEGSGTWAMAVKNAFFMSEADIASPTANSTVSRLAPPWCTSVPSKKRRSGLFVY